MTQEIIEMAREAGWTDDLLEVSFVAPMLERFANLVAAKALAKEKALQALHSENERLGLYKDAYAQPEQEPVKIAHRHEWFRTGEMKVGQMRCISCGTWGQEAYAQRPWVDLTRTQMQDVYFAVLEEHRGGHQMEGQLAFGEALQAKIKERNT